MGVCPNMLWDIIDFFDDKEHEYEGIAVANAQAFYCNIPFSNTINNNNTLHFMYKYNVNATWLCDHLSSEYA